MTCQLLLLAALLMRDQVTQAFISLNLSRPHAYTIVSQIRDRSIPVVSSIRLHSRVSSNSQAVAAATVLKTLEALQSESNAYADSFGLGPAEAAFYGLFSSLRQSRVQLGLRGQPFVLNHAEIEAALRQPTHWPGFFTMNDLEKAVSDDFLDAARGSTDNRKGWKITDVSIPRGESFEEARMTFADVEAALEKGTVIMNAAGAHIPRLAGPSLALTDAVALPCALNLYVTAAGKRTSAPPHTDKQDVCVVQTAGRKSWKVFSYPDPSLKPSSDIFSRGKGDDSLPLYSLGDSSELLLETTLSPGDVLFIPAGFPHTTSTANDGEDAISNDNEASIHLTLGVDHHIWELDYLSVRRLAYRRAGKVDILSSDQGVDNNPFTGKVNMLPSQILTNIMAELPLGFLEEGGVDMIGEISTETNSLVGQIDAVCQVERDVIEAVTARVRQQGMELLDTHRDMYLAALEEGRIREAEDGMTAHLDKKSSALSPERMQRLSLFRVKRYYDKINESKKQLYEWSLAGATSISTEAEESDSTVGANWAFTLQVSVGDQVEADLGGAFFPASVTRASGGSYDVAFFDGDRETGLARNQIKLLVPPKAVSVNRESFETSKMTPKQLKRWKKEQTQAGP